MTDAVVNTVASTSNVGVPAPTATTVSKPAVAVSSTPVTVQPKKYALKLTGKALLTAIGNGSLIYVVEVQ